MRGSTYRAKDKGGNAGDYPGRLRQGGAEKSTRYSLSILLTMWQ